VASPQTLSEADRRIVAAWAADCAERVLGLFEAEAPADRRPRDAIARARAFARGELDVAGEIRRRFVAHGAARDVKTPAAVAAARAAGQATAIPHMGAHALGAAAYAAKAAALAAPDRPEAVRDEIHWQLRHMSPAVRAALQQLPPVGKNSSGPLGPGLLASGLLGTIVRDLQFGLAESTFWHGESAGAESRYLRDPRIEGNLATGLVALRGAGTGRLGGDGRRLGRGGDSSQSRQVAAQGGASWLGERDLPPRT
jgi:hypothetical protein